MSKKCKYLSEEEIADLMSCFFESNGKSSKTINIGSTFLTSSNECNWDEDTSLFPWGKTLNNTLQQGIP